MIAKAATISHGGNAVRYSVNKDKAEIVKVNFCPMIYRLKPCISAWYSNKKNLPVQSTKADRSNGM